MQMTSKKSLVHIIGLHECEKKMEKIKILQNVFSASVVNIKEKWNCQEYCFTIRLVHSSLHTTISNFSPRNCDENFQKYEEHPVLKSHDEQLSLTCCGCSHTIS